MSKIIYLKEFLDGLEVNCSDGPMKMFADTVLEGVKEYGISIAKDERTQYKQPIEEYHTDTEKWVYKCPKCRRFLWESPMLYDNEIYFCPRCGTCVDKKGELQ